MIGLVVTGHGQFAEGLHTSARMIAGENDHVKYVCFEEGMGLEELAQQLNAAYAALSDCEGIVVLSDLPGGSPFKTAVECAVANPDNNIEVLAGTNLPMLITAATMIAFESDPKALADEVMFEGKDNIVRFELTAPVVQDEEEDGI